MIPNPIIKVLSTLSCHEVRHLLMGGQACVFYGAAEFSRDCDIVIPANHDNLQRLEGALKELQAECIAIPPFDPEYLERGHAVHFRCHHTDAMGMRLDVMTRMRGCDEFAVLWERRLSLEDADGATYELLGIEDLVMAKKTQQDKDWPMIRRLVDAHYEEFRDSPNEDQIRFWLRESRTPEVLIRLASSHPVLLREVLARRKLLGEALSGSRSAVQQELTREELAEREADETYWQPLKRELEQLRFKRRTSKQD
ncbi:MAG: hypothetical protein JNL58_14680 [Planctomyces sp.]|nr:hypothetical protein [Planctomyces sp.]